MDSENKLGMNRTGKDMAPRLSKEMLTGTEELTLPRCPEGNEKAIANNRVGYMNDAESVGSVPIPGSAKGMVKTGFQMLKGNDPKLLIDKLGERLAFERSGVRLYDALISKFQGNKIELSSVVAEARLEEIRDEELDHFHLVADVMRQLGADPTAVTPAADITGVAATGLIQVLSDPRINFIQSLDAILTAELTDNDCWDLLIQMADRAGLDDVSNEFQNAYAKEQEHLETIREWIQQFRLGEPVRAKQIA